MVYPERLCFYFVCQDFDIYLSKSELCVFLLKKASLLDDGWKETILVR